MGKEGGLRTHQQTYNNIDNTIANHAHGAVPSTSSIVLYQRRIQAERLERNGLNNPGQPSAGYSAICLTVDCTGDSR
jgi:hypothetical protein